MCQTQTEFQQYMDAQVAEILGDFNMWVAGVHLQHPPSENEAAFHYIKNGGPENFRKRWERERAHAPN